MPCQTEHIGYIQGHIVELGLTMPPSQFCVGNPIVEFIRFARGLLFEGNVLAYDHSTKEVEWIPMCGTISDLSRAKEVSALMLCNMVLHIPDEGAERLDRFGEHRDINERGGGVREASSAEVHHEEEVEEETMGEDDEEEEGHEEDDEYTDDEDGDEESQSHSSSGSTQEGPHSTHHYSDRCHHPHNWAEQNESGNDEDSSFGELSVS